MIPSLALRAITRTMDRFLAVVTALIITARPVRTGQLYAQTSFRMDCCRATANLGAKVSSAVNDVAVDAGRIRRRSRVSALAAVAGFGRCKAILFHSHRPNSVDAEYILVD
jgi:hypothetical protein